MSLVQFVKTISFLAVFASVSAWAIGAGEKAPDFSLKNQDGNVVNLSSLKGKPILLYFYPKDETPGCTKEACTLRDSYSKFQKAGAVILGVSRQNEKSHQEFRKNQKLPFDLLVDSDGAVAEKYGVGKIPVLGLLKRMSVLIAPDQTVIRFYDSVDPTAHAAEVLKDIEAYQASHKSG